MDYFLEPNRADAIVWNGDDSEPVPLFFELGTDDDEAADSDASADAAEDEEGTEFSLTEDEAVAEAARLLPHDPFFFETREDYVRRKLNVARKKAASHPEWDEETVVSKFWDDDDRAVLQKLLELGIGFQEASEETESSTAPEEA